MIQLRSPKQKPSEISLEVYNEYRDNKRSMDVGSFLFNTETQVIEWFDLNDYTWHQTINKKLR